jgi:hypothetical protein
MEAVYLLSHLREQLACQAGELAIEVAFAEGGCICLTGTVTSAERRIGLERIAEAMSDGRAVVNEIRVVPPVRPAQKEPEQVS